MKKKMCSTTSLGLPICGLDNFRDENINCDHQVSIYVDKENMSEEALKKAEVFSGYISLCKNFGNCSYKGILDVYSTGSFVVENEL